VDKISLPLASKVATARGWDTTMREIMLASKSLPVLNESFRIAENKVGGCLSDVWIAKSDSGVMAWSDSKIIRGVLAVLLEKANSQNNQDETDYEAYLTSLGMARYLSESRTSGIRHVINRLAEIR